MSIKNKKYLDWSRDKNRWLIQNRNISFEEIKAAIANNKRLIGVFNHPNQKKYPKQKIYLLKINDYVYQVPFVEDNEKKFLKTIIPSRKMTKKYLPKKTK